MPLLVKNDIHIPINIDYYKNDINTKYVKNNIHKISKKK